MVTGTRLIEKVLLGVAKRWIAGETIDDALKAAQLSYKNGINVIINKLGEYNTSKRAINATVGEYKTILSSLRKSKVEGGISIKLTQIGLSRGRRECLRNLKSIIKTASSSHAFVWLDMESSDHTDETIGIYQSLFTRYERLGMALQANLKRTRNDLRSLIHHGAKIRLVKGAYSENSRIAYKSKKDVDKNYVKLMKSLFKNGNEFGVATHDSDIIDCAVRLSKRYQKKFEFQMLKGIRDELKPELIKKGFEVSDYIPYGTNWLPYSIRRLKERKRNILLLGSSFLHSQRV
ncbi:MAG: proline dehydrogenase family protein [Nitrosopumilaceae archaeon]